MTRDEMIRLLVLDRLEYRDDHARYLHLQKVLEYGFLGYRKLSDNELASEIRSLRLSDGLDDDLADEHYEETEAFADDRLFDTSLAVGHAFSLKMSREYSK